LLTGVEDQQRPQGDKDFNDLVFYITAVEVEGIDTTQYNNPVPTPVDTDNDGVPDDVDEYPTDPQRAFNVYYPSQNTFGTLAFEDLWPSKGDYDFNDMVVDYNIRHVTNALNQIVEVFGTLKLRAMGAGYQNGFGFQLGALPGDIANIEFTFEDNSTVNQPLEQGQTKAVFITWQNGFNLLPNQGGEVGVNTSHAETQVDPYELDFHIITSQPVRLSDFGVPPYNPFIYVNQERGKEVHLSDNPPTNLASSSYFGTLNDASDPGNSIFYKTSTGLPWAIHIAESLSYPVEKVQILNAYTHFAEWAQSGGTTYTDWYKDLPGYRVAGNIY
jgi:LruC domain-containing protein